MNDQSLLQINCGVDETGLGSLFGPLVVCATANPRNWKHPDVKDSKAYASKNKRDRVAQIIRENMAWCMVPIPAPMIDKYGVTRCLDIGFAQSVAGLITDLARTNRIGSFKLNVVNDGNRMENYTTYIGGCPCNVTFKVKADRDVFEVSAASVIAKSWRDGEIKRWADSDPDVKAYGIGECAGYHSETHIAALATKGLLPDHRKAYCKTALTTYRNRNPHQLELF